MQDYTILSDQEKDALVKKAVDTSIQTETNYGSCMQSCLYGLRSAFPDIGITEEMLQASYGIAGGCGCSIQGTCGALNAAACVLSLFYGRPATDIGGDYGDCYEAIRDIMDSFRQRYGGILCSDVLTHNLGAPYDWKTPEGDAEYTAHNGTYHCAMTVAFCTERVARMIVNGALKDGGKAPAHC